MSVVIKVENLSKQYRLGTIGTGTIADDAQRWWAKVRGKEDPYLKIGEENKRDEKGISDYVWSLKDINFEVRSGEALGIIGRNGAGKSTLLKILSKVTAPTTGSVKIKGRVASLLEVGTGFHPELTGRENVFLNGAILGMTKNEIKNKFDEILDFSGVEKYIDTPVKRYSSGMYVRLAFGVAAHLEPEILIVDEVLAVGDAEFQKKCLGKMKDVSGEGRTVIFVSHNMGAISSLCNSCLLLNNGILSMNGNTQEVINKYYRQLVSQPLPVFSTSNNSDKDVDVISIKINGEENIKEYSVNIYESFTIEIKYRINKTGNKPSAQFVFQLSSGEVAFVSSNPDMNNTFHELGIYTSILEIPANFLNSTDYIISASIITMSPLMFHFSQPILTLNVIDSIDSITRTGYNGNIPGAVRPLLNWKINKEI